MFEITKIINGEYSHLDSEQLFNLVSLNYSVDETQWVKQLVNYLNGDDASIKRITDNAATMIAQVRNKEKKGLIIGIDAFLQQYSLNTQEGIALMCLAESLLRIPDSATANNLIKDKLTGAKWEQYLKQSDSVLVNTSTWGLMLTGKILTNPLATDETDSNQSNKSKQILKRIIHRLGEPVIRQAIYGAMKIMGKQFVLGQDINQAISNSVENRKQGYCHSFDMLGEAAMTKDDATHYFNEYANAINVLAKQNYQQESTPSPSISIKLSALHPRYDSQNESRVITELYDTCIKLITLAKKANIGLTIDAEEMDRLELSLTLFEKLYNTEICRGYGQLGIVVQAYSKRALPVLCWLTTLAKSQNDVIFVRLVKGAYWDSEIKQAQIIADEGYPVFTRKASTDISFLACAQYLLSSATQGAIYPQFASHNAQTIAAIMDMAQGQRFEFQRLHGMGQELYDVMLAQCKCDTIRIYAPVGTHKELLPYLVRRLLENGANSSFVHQLLDPQVTIESLTQHPLLALNDYDEIPNTQIPLPHDIFNRQNTGQPQRHNSSGINLAINWQRSAFFEHLCPFMNNQWQARSVIANSNVSHSNEHKVYSPFDNNITIGTVAYANEQSINLAFASATNAFTQWQVTPVEYRSQCLLRLADLLETNKFELYALCIKEAGKTLQDSIDEVREAIDFCRYYALVAPTTMTAVTLPGPTGETNTLSYQGRGVFVCISPWNFPLAIFLGQISAALVTGNCVIAKAAEQTSLIAHRAVELAYDAGIPKDVLQLLLGTGREIGNGLIKDSRVSGVCFTGSTNTAKHIQRQLAATEGAIIPLIAETGGQNAMIVDSTALPEQVVTDIISSAFSSAGQRCSALRVVYVQDDIANKIIRLLKGAMAELKVDAPQHYHTDLGPVIDAKAQENLNQHIEKMTQTGKVIFQSFISKDCQHGFFIAPFAVEIESIHQLDKEQFGPILHVIRFKEANIQQVINDINSTGYGLTLGIHSRNQGFADYLSQQLNVGNIYINRNQIGAVVGVQPFGGQGLSGTGPKAGGPNYLRAFLTEKTITNNIAAIGGNAALLSQ